MTAEWKISQNNCLETVRVKWLLQENCTLLTPMWNFDYFKRHLSLLFLNGTRNSKNFLLSTSKEENAITFDALPGGSYQSHCSVLQALYFNSYIFYLPYDILLLFSTNISVSLIWDRRINYSLPWGLFMSVLTAWVTSLVMDVIFIWQTVKSSLMSQGKAGGFCWWCFCLFVFCVCVCVCFCNVFPRPTTKARYKRRHASWFQLGQR